MEGLFEEKKTRSYKRRTQSALKFEMLQTESNKQTAERTRQNEGKQLVSLK